MRNIVLGTCVASALALMVVVPRVRGVETWKIVLAAIGVMLFVRAGRERTPR